MYDIIKEAGFEPIENRAIVIKYAPENLNQKLLNFFNMEFYVLQLCKENLILLPFSALALIVKKEIALEIPYDTIIAAKTESNGLNYTIIIQTKTDELKLSAQQEEHSDFRSSGALTLDAQGLKVVT